MPLLQNFTNPRNPVNSFFNRNLLFPTLLDATGTVEEFNQAKSCTYFPELSMTKIYVKQRNAASPSYPNLPQC